MPRSEGLSGWCFFNIFFSISSAGNAPLLLGFHVIAALVNQLLTLPQPFSFLSHAEAMAGFPSVSYRLEAAGVVTAWPPLPPCQAAV